MVSKKSVIIDKADRADRLVVLLHGYTRTPESLDAVAKAVRRAPGFERSYIIRPRLSLGMFSTANLNALARDVMHHIDAHFDEDAHRDIYLVGHSVGALLARKVYISAQGETIDAAFEPELRGEAPRPWVGKVRRIILLAGMNRGWRISHHVSIRKAGVMAVGVIAGRIWGMVRGKQLVIFQVRRGAPFLTQLRLQWLAMRKALTKKKSEPEGEEMVTVQLLGSIDDVVSPDDNIDLVSGREFIYLDVGFTDHLGIVEMDDPDHGEERSKQFIKALSSPLKDLRDESVEVSDYRREPDNSVKDVIFVVHGIRDAGYWTQKIARRVAKVAGKERRFAMVTSSYGYFPMAPFLMAGKRREKVEWLMDQYAEAVAYYPEAKFSCVAHSNGTYLIAKALELYPACHFQHVVFAGSVVRQQYDWNKLLPGTGDGRVQAVANYVATRDLIVAWFPKLFQFLQWQDLGSAGHDGFDEDPHGAVYDQMFVKGGHSAALDERNWTAIARFIVTGKIEPVPAALEAKCQAGYVRFFGYCPPAIWILIILALGGIAWLLCSWIANPATQTLALIVYVWCIWKILTRI